MKTLANAARKTQSAVAASEAPEDGSEAVIWELSVMARLLVGCGMTEDARFRAARQTGMTQRDHPVRTCVRRLGQDVKMTVSQMDGRNRASFGGAGAEISRPHAGE